MYADARIPTESERVRDWRLQQALRAGVPLLAAEDFAAGNGDLHQLLELIDRGCDPATAAKIIG